MSQWLLKEGVIDPITLNYIILFDGTSQWLLEEGVTDSVRHALMRASLLHWARTFQGISTEKTPKVLWGKRESFTHSFTVADLRT
jgi:hypothetical protein